MPAPPRDPELQTRVCRGCDRAYDYPVHKSLATRFYCDDCAQLPERVRTVIERLNKRVRQLEKRLKAAGPAAGSRPLPVVEDVPPGGR